MANLRRLDVYKAVRGALDKMLSRQDFRIVHFSIQRNHLHLIAEAADKMALSRGMQGFLISAARKIKRAFRTNAPGCV